jgi:hypothetical protein
MLILRRHMSLNTYKNVAYSLGQPTSSIFPDPIPSKRNPTTTDFANIGQLWINTATAQAYILVQILGGSATWSLLEASGGAGVFTTLTSTGATNLATTGASNVTIATTGTGYVHMGNATGGTAITGATTVTGTLGATGLVTVNSGTAVTAGGAIAITVGGGATAPQILSGSGAPTLAAAQGSLYLRTDGSTDITRAYIATDNAGTWTPINTVG